VSGAWSFDVASFWSLAWFLGIHATIIDPDSGSTGDGARRDTTPIPRPNPNPMPGGGASALLTA